MNNPCIHCKSKEHTNEECYFVIHGEYPSLIYHKKLRKKCKCHKLPFKICALCKIRNDSAKDCTNLCNGCRVTTRVQSAEISTRVAEALLYVHRPIQSML